MKTIYIRAVDPESKSAGMLKGHLVELGHKVVRNKEHAYDVILCWGCSNRGGFEGVPAVNANVNLFNKYEALLKFKRAGCTIPVVFPLLDAVERLEDYKLPWFARKIAHEKGKDIICCETADVVKAVVRNRSADFFSVYVQHEHEYRVWVYDNKAFAVYKKIYAKPGLYNFKHLDIRTELRDDLLKNGDLCEQAIRAIKSLKMDFGAVDILYNTRQDMYVLEVNSTPDISSEIRVNGIRLAKLVSKWAEAQA